MAPITRSQREEQENRGQEQIEFTDADQNEQENEVQNENNEAGGTTPLETAAPMIEERNPNEELCLKSRNIS